ncbi:MAG TPA: hypothetical protein VG448_06450 [Solirubrobacterales bacterium]|nr:hypothetical protein [Solirubrobacterales bacterium]
MNEANMGPAAFARRNPGVDLRDAIRHFKRLEDLECIELVERSRGRGREHIYRPVRRALFDASSWLAVPDERKAGVTGEAMSTFMDRVAHAARCGTLDARTNRHVTWTALQFDEVGWREFLPAMNSAFYASLQLHIDAALRMRTSGEQPIPLTVGLFCFESPENADGLAAAKLKTDFTDAFVGLRDDPEAATPRMVRILVELNKRLMSANAFHRRFGTGSLKQVANDFRRLESMNLIELVNRRSRRGRGGGERVYRAVQRSLFDEDAWRALPASIRAEITGVTYTTFVERVAEAAAAGTLTCRDDLHFTWTGMHYDERAWTEMLGILLDLFKLSLRVHEDSAERQLGTPATPVTVGISCFESPSFAQASSLDTMESFLAAGTGPKPFRPAF